MDITNTKQPEEFPPQVVVMDVEFGKKYPSRAFHLRVSFEDGIEVISLNDAITPIQARQLARDMGYEPSHWIRTTDAVLVKYN